MVDAGRDRSVSQGRSVRWLAQVVERLHPDHLRIARAGLWLLLFTLIAKLAAAGKEIAVAWRYGRGPEVDAYNLALTLSTWLPVTLYSVAGVVLVPALVRIGCNPGQQAFLRELNGVAVVVGAALAALTWVAAAPLAELFAADLAVATREITADMLRSFAPLAFLTLAVAVLAIRMQALHDHRYALAEGAPAVAIVALLALWPAPAATPLVAGTLLGFVAQLLWLWSCVRARGGGLGISLGFSADQWAGLWRAALVMGAGQLAISLTLPIDQWFAARVGPGALATLGYANRLIALGMTLGATVISRATLPIFSEQVADGPGRQVRRHALRWAGLMLMFGAVGAVLVVAAAETIVALLFERGAFSAQDTREVAGAVRWGVWQLPPYLAGLVLVSCLAAQRRYKTIAAIAAVNLMTKSAGNLLLAGPFGLNGVLFCTALMYALSSLLCWVAVAQAGGRGQEGVN